MKRFLSVVLIALAFLSFSACKDSSEFEQDPVTLLQNDVIATFGISQTDKKIVSYLGENNYVKYILIRYENGSKVSEVTHYFYNNDADFEDAQELYASDSAVTIDAEKRHISMLSAEIHEGSYKADCEKLESKGFHIKKID
ncbi:MAG: hypothetical protein IJ264_02385 [Clostridia bacterium]|nr:hypothetical protein [Clostridia bacterium]